MNKNGLHALSQGVAEDFLQTVVVLDDQAYMGSSAPIGMLVVPSGTAIAVGEDEDEKAAIDPDGRRRLPTLDAGKLVSGFAERGLVCAVLTGLDQDGGVGATLRAARRADIVILDWRLGDHGEKATAIILQLVRDTVADVGRSPMVVVYSATRVMVKIREQLATKLPGFKAIDRPGRAIALHAPHTTILFIRKATESDQSGGVSETDLPARLIEEFAKTGDGILRNVALGGIAAIRSETRRILARLHSGMDGPFLTHRVLLRTPEDADAYAVDLLGSEVVSVLRARDVGTKYAGVDAIRGALEEWESRGRKFRLMKGTGQNADVSELPVGDVMKLVEAGQDGLEGIPNVVSSQKQKEALYKRLYRLLADNAADGIATHLEFARVSTHVKDHNSMGKNERATLTLGSIIRRGEEYLLCIQPVCDSVRVKPGTHFVFTSLQRATEELPGRLDIVVREIDGDEVCLHFSGKSTAVRTRIFSPDEAGGRVLSVVKDSGYVFVDTDGEEYIWICELRRSFSQRFVHRIASNLSRIGLAEFEWQRRHAGDG